MKSSSKITNTGEAKRVNEYKPVKTPENRIKTKTKEETKQMNTLKRTKINFNKENYN